ncbi:hypothetical protein UPYG_G00229310 [Umbra pygmaea]|uniref:Uncharacterized protein n=1 Tax=Umbra pygmaea TaxID=75934 RepID=A0ABD0WHY5_UMBPY
MSGLSYCSATQESMWVISLAVTLRHQPNAFGDYRRFWSWQGHRPCSWNTLGALSGDQTAHIYWTRCLEPNRTGRTLIECSTPMLAVKLKKIQLEGSGFNQREN